jgi:hypothetical protein
MISPVSLREKPFDLASCSIRPQAARFHVTFLADEADSVLPKYRTNPFSAANRVTGENETSRLAERKKRQPVKREKRTRKLETIRSEAYSPVKCR